MGWSSPQGPPDSAPRTPGTSLLLAPPLSLLLWDVLTSLPQVGPLRLQTWPPPLALSFCIHCVTNVELSELCLGRPWGQSLWPRGEEGVGGPTKEPPKEGSAVQADRTSHAHSGLCQG